jgi:SAM-dependent methyltransferase
LIVWLTLCGEFFDFPATCADRTMDARDLKFDENSFDTIIDKGCFDSVSCAIDSKSNAIDVMNSVYRTLRPGGKFVVRILNLSLAFS